MSETIRVRVCVAVLPDDWSTAAWKDADMSDDGWRKCAADGLGGIMEPQYRWITATVPAYVAPVEAEVEADGVEVET